MPRLFIAINIPSKIKEEINEKFLKELKRYENFKVVPKENLHITLLFLGEIPQEKINEIKNKLSKIKFEKFKINLSTLGHFSHRVIWIYADTKNNLLNKLSKEIQNSLGIYDERFHPHVTICRVRRPSKKIEKILEKLSKKKFSQEIIAEKISLMQSFLKAPAPEYKEIFSVSLI